MAAPVFSTVQLHEMWYKVA